MYTALRSQSHSAWASMDVIDQQGPVSQKPSASTYNTDNSFFDRYRLSCDVRLPQSVSLSLLSCVVSPGRVEAGTEVVGGYGSGRSYGDPPSYSERQFGGQSSHSAGQGY